MKWSYWHERSISRAEERDPRGGFYRDRGVDPSEHGAFSEQRDPAAIPARGWHHDPEPTEEEESER